MRKPLRGHSPSACGVGTPSKTLYADEAGGAHASGAPWLVKLLNDNWVVTGTLGTSYCSLSVSSSLGIWFNLLLQHTVTTPGAKPGLPAKRNYTHLHPTP